MAERLKPGEISPIMGRADEQANTNAIKASYSEGYKVRANSWRTFARTLWLAGHMSNARLNYERGAVDGELDRQFMEIKEDVLGEVETLAILFAKQAAFLMAAGLLNPSSIDFWVDNEQIPHVPLPNTSATTIEEKRIEGNQWWSGADAFGRHSGGMGGTA